MTEEANQICRYVFDHLCPSCSHRKKSKTDCSIHKSILVPVVVNHEEPYLAEQTVLKLFDGNNCKSFEAK